MPPLTPTVIELGGQVALWVRWQVGSLCNPGEDPPVEVGAGRGLGPRIDVAWSVFGVPRTSEIDLGYEVFAMNDLRDPLRVCPPSG